MASETDIAEAATTFVHMETPRGDTAETAAVVRLYVAPGDIVEAGAAVCLLHTDRFLYALPAPTSGLVERCFVEAGAETKPGQPLLSIAAIPPEPTIDQEILPPALRATPLARVIAAAHGLDLQGLPAASHDGRIWAADVRTALGQSNGHVPAPINGTQASSQEAAIPPFIVHDHCPQALTAIEVECERGTSDEDSTARIVHATAQALIEHPWLNSRWTEEGVLLYGRLDLGLWRDTADGHNLTLLPRAAELSLRGIERAMARAPLAAEESPTQVMLPTFTITFTNTGWWSDAIIPAGSAALLHVGTIERRVVVESITEHLVICDRRLLVLIYDARYISQSEADSLLSDVQARVEQRRCL